MLYIAFGVWRVLRFLWKKDERYRIGLWWR